MFHYLDENMMFEYFKEYDVANFYSLLVIFDNERKRGGHNTRIRQPTNETFLYRVIND